MQIRSRILQKFMILSLGLCFFFIPPLHARQNASTSETESKLKKLNEQIQQLQKKLRHASDRQALLNKELSDTEKQIGKGILELRSIQNNIQKHQKNIHSLQNQADKLDGELTGQQTLLAKHIKARYQMGEYQPLKWLVSQKDPARLSRLMTYYQYFVKSRLQLMDEITLTQKKLKDSQQQLQMEVDKQQTLHDTLLKHQQKLVQTKKYHSALIANLDKDINNKKLTLNEYKKNKDNLTQLLKTLAQQSIQQQIRPFYQMRHKLPLPVSVDRRSIEKKNQGLTFFAQEGATVSAIYPGKVVFSDWLRGYGLLLIIDHGHGYMSLYAHNESLFKQKGEDVFQNEQIASVGHSGGIKENGLYFEIRHQGKVVSPLQWLS